ncbi:transposase family protein [Streptomyces tubercidicus]|uniref:transposase family protein n=1 Tax=Streptomyces tubercidicus TaxID=47759 RepID=UPI002E0F3ADF|nr:transposase family protein [Streptomyces tubercidicus]
MCRQSATVCLVKSPALEDAAGLSLVERLRMLPDPCRRRGARHPFAAVLLVAASAVVAGARSYAAIGQWSASAPQHALARLGARMVGGLGVRVAPSAATIRRGIGLVCPGGLADLTGADPGDAPSLAVDGKTARGSRHGQTPAAHLLAAMTGDGRAVTQLRVPEKTNEITCFAALLEPYDLTGVTVTGLGLDFPHAVQAVRVLRYRTDLKSGRCSRQTVCAITDLTSNQASPQRLGQLARSQWTIENRLHFVRDTSFGEDARRSEPATGPRTWPPCASWRSTRSGNTDTETLPPASATSPTTPSIGRWTC